MEQRQEAILEARVGGLGRVYYSKEPFNRADLGVKGDYENTEKLTIRDLAYSRIKCGAKSHITQKQSHVAEGFLFHPEEGIFLISGSLNPLSDGYNTVDKAEEKQIQEIRNIANQDKRKKEEFLN